MKRINVVSLACLYLALTLSACVPTSGSDPPSANRVQATAVIPVTPMSGTFVVAADVAVVRFNPSLDADVLVSLEAGDVVQVNGLSGAETWYRVVTNQGEGWVVASFLTPQLEAPVASATLKPSATAKRSESMATASLTPTLCAGAPAGWVQYGVQSGDTLASLAGATGTTVANLRQANCMDQSDNMIYAGLPLWVPRLPPPTAPPPDTPTATPTIVLPPIPPPPVTSTATPTKFQPPRRVPPTETPRAEP